MGFYIHFQGFGVLLYIHFQNFGINIGINFQKFGIDMDKYFFSWAAHTNPKLGQVSLPWETTTWPNF